MLNFFLRRVSRFILPLKILALVMSLGTIIYLLIKTPPEIGTVVLFSIFLFVLLSLVFSFFLSASHSFLIAVSVSFFLFLKAVGLLSILNIVLFIIFLVLLALYLYKK